MAWVSPGLMGLLAGREIACPAAPIGLLAAHNLWNSDRVEIIKLHRTKFKRRQIQTAPIHQFQQTLRSSDDGPSQVLTGEPP
jgi:hypothetical protein